MKKSLLFVGVGVVVIIAAIGWWYLSASPGAPSQGSAPTASGGPQAEIRLTPRKQMGPEQAALVKQVVYAPAVEQIVAEKVVSLQTLATDPTVLQETGRANVRDAQLSANDITRLDQDWLDSKTVTPFVQPFLTNAPAERLLAFQKEHSDFKEVFIADAYGLIVASTNKTSDYYQADEAWWVNAMNGGKGKVVHGKLEFDQSSQTEAVSLYIPILDSSNHAVGVIKGVLDISSISGQL